MRGVRGLDRAIGGDRKQRTGERQVSGVLAVAAREHLRSS